MHSLRRKPGIERGPEADFLVILRNSKVFRSIPEADQRALAARGRLERFEERTLLAELGHPPTHIRYVVSGSVDLIRTTHDGRIASLPIFRGHWAIWLGCFTRAPLDYEMWSSAGAVYVSFPADAVRQAVSKHSEALLGVIELVGVTTRFLITWTLLSAVLSPERRLATFLLLATEMASSPALDVNRLRLSQEQFSQLGLGSRQRVGRMLRDLAGRGLVEMRYGEVVICSREALRRFADED